MKQYLLVLFLMISATPVTAKEVVGWTEKVLIYPGFLEVRAKIDSGAKTSSLNCNCSDFFEKNGEKWVRFTVTNYQGQQVQLERKIQRIARIKRHFGGVQERPVVKLGICLGGVYQEAEVNVIDRSGLKYPMLIGRNFLENRFLVDSGAQFINPPKCDFEFND